MLHFQFLLFKSCSFISLCSNWWFLVLVFLAFKSQQSEDLFFFHYIRVFRNVPRRSKLRLCCLISACSKKKKSSQKYGLPHPQGQLLHSERILWHCFCKCESRNHDFWILEELKPRSGCQSVIAGCVRAGGTGQMLLLF